MNERTFKISSLAFSTVFCAVSLVLAIVGMVLDLPVVESLASVCFVLVAAVFLAWNVKAKTKIVFPALMLIVLVLSMVGDVMLCTSVSAGIFVIALGQVLLFVAFATLQKIRVADLLIGGVVFVPTVLFAIEMNNLDWWIYIIILDVIFALVFSLMVGKAVSVFLAERSPVNTAVMIGGVLLFLSDLALLIVAFMMNNTAAHAIRIATYYPAQFVLVISLFFYCMNAKNPDVGALHE